jgi:hypothetical protein
MTRIVRHAYRYKRPPRKRKAVALEVAAVVKAADPAKASKRGAPPSVEPTGTPIRHSDEAIARSPAIVSSCKRAALADVSDLTPEELQRRDDTADALWRELVCRATGKKRP